MRIYLTTPVCRTDKRRTNCIGWMRIRSAALLCVSLGLLLLAACSADEVRPNVLLIVVDDMGYTDIAPYGSEIETPTLDGLARNGAIFSQFYASPMCSPTRAMLLTGLDNHRTGLGNLKERMADNQRDQPGYEGYLASPAPTLPEHLHSAGYRTYMTGKWHLGSGIGSDPAAHGFERHFALHDSGASHFSDMLSLSGPETVHYADDGRAVTSLPDDFYSTRFYTDKLIEYLESDSDSKRPFFAYLAYTAPHFPLQAPADTIEKYRDRYQAGYAAIAQARRQRASDFGLFPSGAQPFPGTSTEPQWHELGADEKEEQAKVMAIYAAMIDEVDANIGRLLAYLEQQEQRENTLIIFLSDNGAEGHRLSQGMGPLYDWSRACCDNSTENLGLEGSYVTQGPQWATVSVSPFRMFKGFASEGGIRVPAIISLPNGAGEKGIQANVASVTDILPTVLDLLDLSPGPDVLDGQSLLPALLSSGDVTVAPDERVIGWELLGKRALRSGDWKIVRESPFVDWWDSERIGIRKNVWQLYNLAEDPAELDDLAESNPQRLDDMIGKWEAYAERNGVVLPDTARDY